MKYICLSKYSHIRCADNYAYIANQSTGKQLVFDANGGLFLRFFNHAPQRIDQIITNLALFFIDVDRKVLAQDFLDFAINLAKEGFVILGENLTEITYSNNNETIDLQLDIPPISDLSLEITNCCNERCVHCYLPNKLKSHGRFMNINLIKRLIDEYTEMGGESITLTGGEVFLHPDLSEILRFIDSKRMNTQIYSNLTLLSKELIQELKKIRISNIQVSLYGVTPEVHDAITMVKGSCALTKKAIDDLLEADLPIKIACSVLKQNRNDIINILEYAKKKKIEVDLELNITPREDQSKDNLTHRLTIEEMELFLRGLIVYDKVFTINLLFRHKNKYDKNYNFAEYLNYPVCTAGHYGLYITADGKVTTCPNFQGFDIAHIGSSSLKAIWYENHVINELRRTTECSFEQCVNCEASDYCFRCFARNYTETGNYMKSPKYACEMAFLAKRIIEEYK